MAYPTNPLVGVVHYRSSSKNNAYKWNKTNKHRLWFDDSVCTVRDVDSVFDSHSICFPSIIATVGHPCKVLRKSCRPT
ncbi:hypothetical protein SDJN02_01329, partial [Cucurbita argyrosperma subsp. argyrosperma]